MISTHLLCPKREFCQVSSNVVDSDFTAFGGIFVFCVVVCGDVKIWENGVRVCLYFICYYVCFVVELNVAYANLILD